jgi:acetyl-CoA C-acetyltransferase
MIEVVIASAARTPIGKYGGGLKDVPATELGAIVVREAVERAGIEAGAVDEVIMGNVLSAGLGENPARQASIGAGLPFDLPAFTVNKVCASGMTAVMLAARAIRSGEADIIVAGAMESMSRAPYLLENARFGYRMGDGKIIDAMIRDGLWDAYEDVHMGMCAELLVEKYGIGREEQDRFAFESHRKAIRAIDEGRFKHEIVPVETPRGVVNQDEGPRRDTSLEALSQLKPAFKDGGTVTAGNASQLSDGASALVIMSAEKAMETGVEPLARIAGYSTTGIEPKFFTIAPISAVREVLQRTGLALSDIDRVEENEAFAIQALAVGKELGFDWDKVNVNGGAVALGHPLGCSGARIVTTLAHEMARSDAKRGIATLCVGGGHGVAMLLERNKQAQHGTA